jgi:hypothetical protein
MKTGLIFAAVIGILVTAPLGAAITYSVQIDTSSLTSTNPAGYLDFSFIPGGTDADNAFASVSAFSTDGSLAASATLSGDVTPVNAALPEGFTLGNTQFFNDLFQGITFGDTIDFFVTLSGDAIDSPNPANNSGTEFAFSLYGADQQTPLLTTSIGGNALGIDVGPDGIVTADYVSDAVNAQVTPEPAPFALLLSGAGALAGFGFHLRKKAR